MPSATKKEKQDRHHDLVGLFNAAGNAERHDEKAHRNCDHDPDICAPRVGSGIEAADDRIHVLTHGRQSAVKRQKCILEDPTHDAGVADGQRQRPEHRDVTDELARLAFAEARLGAHAERADRTGAARAAECKFSDDAGRGDEDDKEEVRDEEGHAAPLGHQRREAPDVAHTDGRADAGDDEAAAAAKAVAVIDVCVITHDVVSFHALGTNWFDYTAKVRAPQLLFASGARPERKSRPHHAKRRKRCGRCADRIVGLQYTARRSGALRPWRGSTSGSRPRNREWPDPCRGHRRG